MTMDKHQRCDVIHYAQDTRTMTHPDFPHLFDYAADTRHVDPEVVSHVGSCGLCQMAVASIRGESTPATWQLEGSSPASETLPELAPGQVWRIEWSSDTSHVVVVEVAEATVEVLPIAEDPELIEDLVARWPANESPVGFTAGIWQGPRVTLLSFLFDRYYDQVDLPTLPENPTEPVPSNPAAAALIASVVSRLQSLSAADWVPKGDGQDWDAALMAAGVTYAQLASALSLNNAEIEDLVAGGRLLSDEQQLLIADLLGRAPGDLPGAAALPSELVQALNRPTIRPDIRSKAVELEMDEVAARRTVGRELVAAEHRTTGRGSGREFWERVVDDYFHR